MSTDDEGQCRHGTPDYADCDACADDLGMKFIVVNGVTLLVEKSATPETIAAAFDRRDFFTRRRYA